MVNGIVEVGSTQSSPSSAGLVLVATGPFCVGDVVGGAYAITGVLGAGGMGVVYDAVDHGLKRRVALKAAAAPFYAAALEAEGRALAALRSPFFVQVHALGEHEGTPFLVMERLVGETLERRIADARARGAQIPVSEVVDVLIMIAEGLSIAHTAGLSQRDLKPSNVIVSGGRVVLFDFGIAVPEALVEPGAVLSGSLEYMAPEVVLGTVKRGDGPMVDLYALGIVAYELLTHTTPFHGGPAREVLTRRLFEPAPDVRDVRPDVPPELAALVGDLLAMNVSCRPPGAEAVLWQLEELSDRGARRSQRSLTVLAVDDELHVGIALKRSLESAYPRIQVEVITDPGEAIAASSGAGAIDIALVDMNMPRHNGLEVCMHLLATPRSRRPAVVAMSAAANDADVAVLHALGVRDFVRKDDSFLSSMNGIIARFRANAPPSSRPSRSRS